MEKPFILFTGDTYYPGPGWANYRGSFDTLEDALTFALDPMTSSFDWWQIVDIRLRQIVAGDGEGFGGVYIPADPNNPGEES
jgi:hypothetical protein